MTCASTGVIVFPAIVVLLSFTADDSRVTEPGERQGWSSPKNTMIRP
jgi:hypothetical protein